MNQSIHLAKPMCVASWLDRAWHTINLHKEYDYNNKTSTEQNEDELKNDKSRSNTHGTHTHTNKQTQQHTCIKLITTKFKFNSLSSLIF